MSRPVYILNKNKKVKYIGQPADYTTMFGDDYHFVQQEIILYEELECIETFNNTTNPVFVGIDTGYPTGSNISKIWTKLYIPRETSVDLPIIQNGSYTEKKGVAINYFPSISYVGGNYFINGIDYNSNRDWQFIGNNIAELTYDRNAHTLTFNGSVKAFSDVPDAPSGNTLKIWNNQTGTAKIIIYTGTKFYGYKVWSEGTLVCDLIPAKKEEQYGAYDVVRKIFCPMNNIKVIGNN